MKKANVFVFLMLTIWIAGLVVIPAGHVTAEGTADTMKEDVYKEVASDEDAWPVEGYEDYLDAAEDEDYEHYEDEEEDYGYYEDEEEESFPDVDDLKEKLKEGEESLS